MRKVTKGEQYMYLLGRACTLADIYTLIHCVKPESRRCLIEEWTEVMKEIYETSGLWQSALNQNKVEGEE